MRRIIVGIPLLTLLWSGPAPAQQAAQETGQLDVSPTLFTVMAAINAAGYDAELDSTNNHPLRQALRKYLADRKLGTVEELKAFFGAHRKRDWTQELSQYVSFALSVEAPPDFKYRFRSHELPPDVVPLEGLDRLLTRFYREAEMDKIWQQVQPAMEEAIGRYHEPATRALLEVNGYLRNPTSGFLGRRFQIYVDLLGAPNQIHTRSYRDDYYVVVTPSLEPQTEDIRHAYLHYLLDPLSMKYAEALRKKKGVGDYALAAPHLEDYYKSDFLLLATESLIKAVESRLAPGRAEKKQALVDQALKEGFVLTPAFAELLPVYEKQEQAFRLFYEELVNSIDLGREERRLANIEFSSERPVRKAKVVPAERKVELTGPYKTAEAAEQFYASRDLDKAKAAYLQLLKESSEKSLQAKSYYGLARIAALQNDPELAEKLFQKTLELAEDPQIRAWSHVYLGRLSDIAGQREDAVRNYQVVLALEGASAAARQAAQKGLDDSFERERKGK